MRIRSALAFGVFILILQSLTPRLYASFEGAFVSLFETLSLLMNAVAAFPTM